jgi:hypothetical protein
MESTEELGYLGWNPICSPLQYMLQFQLGYLQTESSEEIGLSG